MSLKIIKAGLLDTVQDLGRYGYQHLGINTGGAMDGFAASVANILAGNTIDEAVIELHFPASAFLFEQDAVISISGADFTPTINGEAIPLLHPVIINKNSVLQFEKIRTGARCYLAIHGGLAIPKWLNSYSTHLKVAAGGYGGRSLQKGDNIGFKKHQDYSAFLSHKDFMVLPWQASIEFETTDDDDIKVVTGNEWDWLSHRSQEQFFTMPCHIANASDRMGYQLNTVPLIKNNQTELISSAVSFGTIQLLPNGQLIILMADHQTTGGYPRIAHVISSHLSKLTQLQPGEKIKFRLTDHQNAAMLLIKQQQHLLQLQNACTFRLQQYFKNG